MKQMIVVLAVCVVLQATAFADLITTDSQNAAGNTLTTLVGGATVYDFDSLTPANITGNYDIVSGSTSSYAAPRHVDAGAVDSTKFFTVPKNFQSNVWADIYFTQDYNYLGLFWGSIDTYNTITFYKDGVAIKSYSGGDVIEPDGVTGSQFLAETNKYVNFFLSESFDHVRFTSTQYAFELDNLAVAAIPVPVPGAALLGFLGLGAAGLRLRRSV